MPTYPKTAFIWSRLPGYAFASLKKLENILGNNLLIKSFGEPPLYLHKEYQKQFGKFEYYPRLPKSNTLLNTIIADLEMFEPELLIVTGWNNKIIRDLAKYFKSKNVTTVCMADTPWEGSFRQIVRSIFGRTTLHKCYDKIWVPGERAFSLAKFSGYSNNNIWRNLYCADTDIYSGVIKKRKDKKTGNKMFLFVGRFEKEKNIEGLIKAYDQYKKNNVNPWGLICIGGGSLEYELKKQTDIIVLPWKESKEIAEIMTKCNALILASLYEPWGVVVHEATSAALPVILSKKVGSGPEFLIDYYNGRYVDPTNHLDIAKAMLWIQNNNEDNILGKRSQMISKKLTLELWTEYVINQIEVLI